MSFCRLDSGSPSMMSGQRVGRTPVFIIPLGVPPFCLYNDWFITLVDVCQILPFQPINLSGVKTGKPCLISGYKELQKYIRFQTYCFLWKALCWSFKTDMYVDTEGLMPRTCHTPAVHFSHVSPVWGSRDLQKARLVSADTQESLQRGPERKSLKQTKSTEIRVYQPDQLMCLCLKRKWVDFASGVSLYKPLHHRNSSTASSWYV